MPTYSESLRAAKPRRTCGWVEYGHDERTGVIGRQVCTEDAVPGTSYCNEHLSFVLAEAGS